MKGAKKNASTIVTEEERKPEDLWEERIHAIGVILAQIVEEMNDPPRGIHVFHFIVNPIKKKGKK